MAEPTTETGRALLAEIRHDLAEQSGDGLDVIEAGNDFASDIVAIETEARAFDVEAAKAKVMLWMTTTRGKQPDLWVPRSWVLDVLDSLARPEADDG